MKVGYNEFQEKIQLNKEFVEELIAEYICLMEENTKLEFENIRLRRKDEVAERNVRWVLGGAV